MKKSKKTDVKKSPANSKNLSHDGDQPASIPDFPIVGIGASAGGLSAFEDFFSGMPADVDPGMAFVLVQHLAPDHKSILAELIQRHTRMQVLEATDGMIVQPNCTYTIPPGHDMAFLNGALQLFEPAASRGLRLPIDFFFRSLAQDQGDRAIAIVLSGTGNDGTLGMRAIKGGGGMVMVQTPESSEYDGMPISAIATGLADYQLSPAEMADALIAYSSHAFIKEKSTDTNPVPQFENNLKKIFILVRAHTSHDFSSYKINTIRRRVERRMAVHQIDSIEEYLKSLQQSNEEIDALFQDLLIGVTNFFRDTAAFDSLKESVIPQLFTGKSPGSTVRVWTAGCSTGEEAYSIAILLREYLESVKEKFSVQIFATDIDPQAIAIARSGIYPASIAADIAPAHLERFFSTEHSSPNDQDLTYRINKSIRDMIIFSEQNMIKDPPFSKLDLISCRNLMIYLSADVQKKIIPLFHYALNPNGFLFLGTSESVGEYTDLFQVVNRKSKLYLRKDAALGSRRNPIGNFFASTPHVNAVSPEPRADKPQNKHISPRVLAEQTLLQHLSPSSALVNAKGDIIYLHGRTGRFLEPAVGEVGGYNIIKMAREGLRNELTTCLRKAVQNKETVSHPNLSVKTNGDYTSVHMTICPAVGDGKTALSERMFLIVFQDAITTVPGNERPTVSQSDDDANILITSLRDELREKEGYLQTTIEELETLNEEQKSTNEEMQSINEEMQSTNEELETSKEELQSVNEELTTVNNELSTKVADLSRANNDMNNLLAGTGIATVFVNHHLQILRFTPTASALINLIQSDMGRPVNHILTNLSDYSDLQADIQSVLDTLIPKIVQVQTISGDWYKMHILPYRTLENVIEGAVITFVNITESQKLQEKLQIQLSEKLALLKEVHHRVKNNIGTIEGLLSLQTYATDNSEVKNAMQDALSRVQSMRILYDKLLLSEDYHEISIKTYIENLIDSLLSVLVLKIDIHVEKKISDFKISSRNAISIGMIVNELMTNIFKYAFPDRDEGSIFVSVEKSENRATLIIHDNGIGIDDNSSPGFGSTIVTMLVEQLHGTYHMVNENGSKTVIEFEI